MSNTILRVIAIDLPGYGKTRGSLGSQKKGEYLGSVISSLSPDSRPVVVSPSMSGSFLVPMLKQVGRWREREREGGREGGRESN